MSVKYSEAGGVGKLRQAGIGERVRVVSGRQRGETGIVRWRTSWWGLVTVELDRPHHQWVKVAPIRLVAEVSRPAPLQSAPEQAPIPDRSQPERADSPPRASGA